MFTNPQYCLYAFGFYTAVSLSLIQTLNSMRQNSNPTLMQALVDTFVSYIGFIEDYKTLKRDDKFAQFTARHSGFREQRIALDRYVSEVDKTVNDTFSKKPALMEMLPRYLKVKYSTTTN